MMTPHVRLQESTSCRGGSKILQDTELDATDSFPPDVPPNLTFKGAVLADEQRKLAVALLGLGVLVQLAVMAINAVIVY